MAQSKHKRQSSGRADDKGDGEHRADNRSPQRDRNRDKVKEKGKKKPDSALPKDIRTSSSGSVSSSDSSIDEHGRHNSRYTKASKSTSLYDKEKSNGKHDAFDWRTESDSTSDEEGAGENFRVGSSRSYRAPLRESHHRLSKEHTETWYSKHTRLFVLANASWKAIMILFMLTSVYTAFVFFSSYTSVWSVLSLGPSRNVDLQSVFKITLDHGNREAGKNNGSSTSSLDISPLSRIEIWRDFYDVGPICRITNVLVYLKADGSRHLLIPQSLRELENVSSLLADCDFEGQQFFFYDDRNAPELPIDNERFDFFRPLDQPLEYHMPHFTRRWLVRDYVLFGLVLGNYSELLRTQETPFFKYYCVKASGERCKATLPTDFRLAYEMAAIDKVQSWVRSFMQALTFSTHFFYEGQALGTKTALSSVNATSKVGGALYFQSVVIGGKSAHIHPQIYPELQIYHPLFTNLGIMKLQPMNFSRLSIVILTRESDFQTKSVGYGRSIVNLDDFIAALVYEASLWNLKVNIKVEYFEQRTFMYQVETMKNVDVLIASHGAGCTNNVFMRRNTLMVELLPFGHAINLFQVLGEAVGPLNYMYHIAPPQLNHVRKCLEYMNLHHPGTRPTTLKEANIFKFFGQFRTLAERYDALGFDRVTGDSLGPEQMAMNMHEAKWGLVFTSACLRHQEFVIDSQKLAKAVFRKLQSIRNRSPPSADFKEYRRLMEEVMLSKEFSLFKMFNSKQLLGA